MIFFVVQDDQGSTIGCETGLKKAHELGKTADRQPYSIERVQAPVTIETVRRLLGQLGGYAIESDTVHP